MRLPRWHAHVALVPARTGYGVDAIVYLPVFTGRSRPRDWPSACSFHDATLERKEPVMIIHGLAMLATLLMVVPGLS